MACFEAEAVFKEPSTYLETLKRNLEEKNEEK
jgi:hypothetical protein